MNIEEKRIVITKDELKGSVRRLRTKEYCKKVKN